MINGASRPKYSVSGSFQIEADNLAFLMFFFVCVCFFLNKHIDRFVPLKLTFPLLSINVKLSMSCVKYQMKKFSFGSDIFKIG